jgi:EF-P beta-lysylation protein EpmB
MITATPLSRHLPAAEGRSRSWQQAYAESITDPAELLRRLNLGTEWLAAAEAAAARFALRVPESFLARIEPGNIDDPLLRQVLPLGAELDDQPGYSSDPIDEAAARRAPGLLHKYAHRALLITTGACALHCRYCFRRDYPYAEESGDGARWQQAIETVVGDHSIREVILSGGDPLSLSTARLQSLTRSLAAAPHVRELRIHTRNAVVLPERVDAALLEWLRSLPFRVTVVLHVNHAQELTGDAPAAIAALRGTGALLLNQTVLLKGVNDAASTLIDLSRRLHELGVLPYYLHLQDRVNGTAHFEVPESRGIELIDALARELPGFLVPRLVREVPGEEAKVVIAAGLRRSPTPD